MSVLSLASLGSFTEEISPIEQLEELAKNNSFAETAMKIEAYLKDGEKIEKAIESVYGYFDTILLHTIKHRLKKSAQDQLKTDIQGLLKRMYKVQHPEHLGRYDVAQLNVRASLKNLVEGMKKMVLETYEGDQEKLVFNIEDGKDFFD